MPSTIDVTSAPQNVEVALEISDSSGVGYGWISISSTSNWGTEWVHFQASDLEDPVFGTAQLDVEIPALAPGGLWLLDEVGLTDSVGNTTTMGAVELQDAGFDHRFEVVSLPIFTGPVLHSVSFDPTSVDVSDSFQWIDVELTATDDGPGFEFAQFGFRSPSGQQSQSATFHAPPVGGVDTYAGTLGIPRYAEAGTWVADEALLRDAAGAYTHLSASDLRVLGLAYEIEVAADVSDMNEPSLVGVNVEGDLERYSGSAQTVDLDVEVADDLSGPGWISMAWATGNHSTLYSNVWLPNVPEGSPDHYIVPLIVPAGASLGTWSLRNVWLYDQAGNQTAVYVRSEIEQLGATRFDLYPDDCTVRIAQSELPTPGDDVICGSFLDDVIDGLIGNDVIYAGHGDDAVTGGFDSDRVVTGAGDDFVAGDNGDDEIRAGVGRDRIEGGAGDDRVAAGTGWDIVLGGPGNDTIYDAEMGWGQEGNDGMTSYRGPVTLYGGAGDDELFFTSSYPWPTKLVGNDGVDLVWGGAGDDVLAGGNLSGPDDPDSANDVVVGAAGDDYLSGGAGDDRLRGQRGRDVIQGSEGDDDIEGGHGRDRLVGDAGADRIVGEDEDDVVVGNDGSDYVDGGAGDDTVVGGNLSGPDDPDSADDVVVGGLGADYLSGGVGNDSLAGGSGGDSMQGGEGHDSLRGDDGDDSLMGDAGNDSIFGDAGGDLVNEGTASNGGDAIAGGTGADSVDYSRRTTTVVVIKDGLANDGASGEGDLVNPDVENVLLPSIVPGGGEPTAPTPTPTLSPSPSPSVDPVPSEGDVTIESSDGTIVIPAGTGVVTIIGDDNDVVVEGDREVVLIGAGNTIMVLGEAGLDVEGDGNTIVLEGGPLNLVGNDNQVTGSDDPEEVRATGQGNVIDLGGGADELTIDDTAGSFASAIATVPNQALGGAGSDILRSGSNGDELWGNGGGDLLLGRGGADKLVGGRGRDELVAGRGNDLLDGGGHADELRGGRGVDSYYATRIDSVSGCEKRLRR